jgi:hypothetical protein
MSSQEEENEEEQERITYEPKISSSSEESDNQKTEPPTISILEYLHQNPPNKKTFNTLFHKTSTKPRKYYLDSIKELLRNSTLKFSHEYDFENFNEIHDELCLSFIKIAYRKYSNQDPDKIYIDTINQLVDTNQITVENFYTLFSAPELHLILGGPDSTLYSQVLSDDNPNFKLKIKLLWFVDLNTWFYDLDHQWILQRYLTRYPKIDPEFLDTLKEFLINDIKTDRIALYVLDWLP